MFHLALYYFIAWSTSLLQAQLVSFDTSVDTSAEFKDLKMGYSILSSQWFIDRTFTDLNPINLSAFESANIHSKLISESVGQNLLAIFDNLQTNDERISVSRMNVSYQIAFASSQEPDILKREYLLHLSLILWPQNAEVAKALAYALECYGHTSAARSLFTQCYLLSGNIGCGLHFILAAPTISWNQMQAERSFKNILADFHVILANNSSATDGLWGFFCTQSHRHIVEFYIGNQSRSLSSYPGCSDQSPVQYLNPPPVIDILLQALPLNLQYLGRPPPIVYSLLGISIMTVYHRQLTSRVPSVRFQLARKRVVRLGVVSESFGNTSPGLCIQSILEATAVREVLNRNGERLTFDIVFFDRPDLYTAFGDSMRAIAKQSIALNPSNVSECASLIAAAKVDVLLYLTLSTERLTFLLGQFRIAPIQIQYGIGHPFSSGLEKIDFSIVPAEMMSPDFLNTRLDSPSLSNELALSCAAAAFDCQGDGDGSQPACLEYNRCSGRTLYSEQTVLFDSLAYFISAPVDMYSGDTYTVELLRMFASNRIPIFGGPSESEPIAYDSNRLFYRLQPSYFIEEEQRDVPTALLTCEELDDKLSRWGIRSNISARDIGCYNKVFANASDSTTTFEVVVGEVVLYSCIQTVKKFHPLFDAALWGILERDPMGKILVFDSFKAVLPRLLVSPFSSLSELYDRFIFVPRLPHEEYLSLLSLTAVFLNPFPFGAGVTSSDALSMCVPVVVMLGQSSVLNFAAAQVRALGLDAELVVSSVAEFAQKSVDIAHSRDISHHLLRDMICSRKHKFLFGRSALEKVVDEWIGFLERLYNGLS